MQTPPPLPHSPPPLPDAGRQYHCPFCGHASDASSTSCPACGATVDVRLAVTKSGWTELPPIKDMAKIQFGQSFCQIEGNYVPVADFKLAAGDWIYFTHHVLLWKEDQIQVTAMSLKGGWKRMFSGLPLVMTQAAGPGRIAFSKDAPGEMVALPLQQGQSIDVREHVFMTATGTVGYDWFNTGIWFETRNGDERETHYPIGMFMDRFTAGTAPGLLLLHGAGNVFVRQLAPGQAILIKPTALLFKDPSVRMNLHFEHPGGTWRSWRSWGSRYLWLRLQGPGRVAVQSNYEHFHDPGYDLTRTEPTSTRYQW
jgi:uncharacterized protein (AIM24 family)